jgi:hypothetical protein
MTRELSDQLHSLELEKISEKGPILRSRFSLLHSQPPGYDDVGDAGGEGGQGGGSDGETNAIKIMRSSFFRIL